MRLFVFGLALANSIPAAAQGMPAQYQPSTDFAQCMRQGDAAEGNSTAVDLCLGLDQTVQLDRMGDAFDRAFDALPGWDQVRLLNDQTEWRAGLDARCAEVARQDPRNSADSRAFNRCRTEAIAARTAWLDDYLPE